MALSSTRFTPAALACADLHAVPRPAGSPTLITAAAGYFKPRERAFNLQQTADSIEQNATALELGIAPYNATEEARNLELFATTVEVLRVRPSHRHAWTLYVLRPSPYERGRTFPTSSRFSAALHLQPLPSTRALLSRLGDAANMKAHG